MKRNGILIFLLLCLVWSGRKPLELHAQEPSAPPLCPENIMLDQTANESGWINSDTTFTVSLPEEWEYGADVPTVEYRKQEAEEWTAMEMVSSSPYQFAFTETDLFYAGSYQFRSGDGSGIVLPEAEWMSVAFWKDREAPVVQTTVPEADFSELDSRYYGGTAEESETVALAFTEEGYKFQSDRNEAPVKPELKVLRDGEEVGAEESADWISWGDFENGQLSVSVTLPYEKEREVVYQIQAVYRDAAGNPLSAAPGSFGKMTEEESGVFVTGSLILDARPPRLTELTVSGNSVQFVDVEGEKIPLYQNVEGADVSLSFAIDDREEDWSESRVSVRIVNLLEERTVVELKGDDGALVWAHEGESHRAVLAFDGETDEEGVYQLWVSYQDRAGNVLSDQREGTGQEECCSESFILDHAAPLLRVSYMEAVRVVKDGKDQEGVRTPVTGCISYYNQDITVEITLTDSFVSLFGVQAVGASMPEGFVLERIGLTDGSEDVLENVTSEICWTQTGEGAWTGTYSISEEGDFRLSAAYKDTAGNPVQAEENAVQGSLQNGRYESPVLVLDRMPPVITAHFSGEAVRVYGERKFFNTETALFVTVADRNFRVQELKEVLEGFRAETSGGEAAKAAGFQKALAGLEGRTVSRTVWETELPLSEDANYEIPLGCTDLAGNQAIWQIQTDAKDGENHADVEIEARTAKEIHTEYITVDTKAPEELTLTCPAGNPVNYLPSGWMFSGEPVTVSADAGDDTAGIREIRFILVDENEKETVSEKIFQPQAQSSFAIKIPDEAENFKGTVMVEAYDWAGNCREEIHSFAAESQAKHEQTGKAVITTLTNPSRTVDGTDYYNTDVTLRLAMEDSFSGLSRVWYQAGDTLSGSRDYAAEAGRDLSGKAEQEITSEFVQELTLEASENNENNRKVSAGYTDHAGHEGYAEQLYHIDVTAPEIRVEYDVSHDRGGQYYNQTRTATVTIRERNFDERDVEFQITNTDGAMPSISGWKTSGSGDDTFHTCTVAFLEDGDYTFTLEFQDLAGNQAAYGRIDTFTIDQTEPELTVTWDNYDCRNGRYYAKSRTAVIEILEHNFSGELIHVTVTGDDAVKELPSLSDWERAGDRSTARVTFSGDGEYTLMIEGEDRAGNRFPTYETEPFVIDTTPPELTLFGIGDCSANRGEVCPGIRFTDANYDPAGYEIVLTGYRNGETETKGSRTELENGAEFRLEDFAYVQEKDDLYTLKAAAVDLAGNRTEQSILFSVNRFGSVYTFDRKTEELVGENGRFYTNQEQDIVIMETNVDTLEFHEITCSRDGTLWTLEEGKDYTVRESGSALTWKQYTYRIEKECFLEEGTYLLTIYSEDRAKNASDTGSKGKTIEFAVDRTVPDVLISGVEDGGQYRESIKEVTVDAADNIRLSEVRVNLNGEETIYSAGELAKGGGRIRLRITGENYRQKLMVTAWDAAGNMTQTETVCFLVTPNLLVQFFMNRTACYAAAGVLAALSLGVVCFLRNRSRRREE